MTEQVRWITGEAGRPAARGDGWRETHGVSTIRFIRRARGEFKQGALQVAALVALDQRADRCALLGSHYLQSNMTNQREGRESTSMSENPEAAFIAKITASTTHELRNVLSIVKESAGLMEDLFQAEEHGATPRPERLRELAGLIGMQVERGAGLVTDLHCLAHSLDPARAGTDLLPELERTASFCERFARERRQTVTVRSATPDVTVAMRPLPLQMGKSVV